MGGRDLCLVVQAEGLVDLVGVRVRVRVRVRVWLGLRLGLGLGSGLGLGLGRANQPEFRQDLELLLLRLGEAARDHLQRDGLRRRLGLVELVIDRAWVRVRIRVGVVVGFALLKG